jgi:hypothetical protein
MVQPIILPRRYFLLSGLFVPKVTMDTIEVKIFQYVFRFRQLSWREETSIQFPPNENRLRVILSYAMTEVSGLKVGTPEDAMKMLRVLPQAVLQRIYIMYKGKGPMPRKFASVGLYGAPAPGKLVRRMEEVEQQRDQVLDRVEREMEQKFGKQELADAREAERLMLKNSKMRGATRATDDRGALGERPPIKQGTISPVKGGENAD